MQTSNLPAKIADLPWHRFSSDLGYTEVVLRTGQFARVREVKVLDYMQASEGCTSQNALLLGLAIRCVLLDDVPSTLAELIQMPYVTFAPIRRLLVLDLDRIRGQLGSGIA